MSSDTKADEFLRTLGREVMKVHRVYDGSLRLTEQWEALANAKDNSPALKTSYTYTGIETEPTNMKEELSVWDSAWDI